MVKKCLVPLLIRILQTRVFGNNVKTDDNGVLQKFSSLLKKKFVLLPQYFETESGFAFQQWGILTEPYRVPSLFLNQSCYLPG